MVDIIDLKASIYSKLTTIKDTHESGRVDKEATMPYIIYELGNSVEDDSDNTDAVNFPLTITVLDHNKEKDTDIIEQLVNDISNLLSYTTFIENDFYWLAIRNGINSGLPTQDEFTFRRELNYTLKTNLKE